MKQKKRAALHLRVLPLSVHFSDLYLLTLVKTSTQKLGFIPTFASLGLGKLFCQRDSTDSKGPENR